MWPPRKQCSAGCSGEDHGAQVTGGNGPTVLLCSHCTGRTGLAGLRALGPQGRGQARKSHLKEGEVQMFASPQRADLDQQVEGTGMWASVGLDNFQMELLKS